MKNRNKRAQKDKDGSSRQHIKPLDGTSTQSLDDIRLRVKGNRPELTQPGDFLALQRAVGNKVVSELVHRESNSLQDPHHVHIVQRVDEEEEEGGGEEPASDREARARELFQEGLDLIHQGQYRQAIIRLERTAGRPEAKKHLVEHRRV